MRKFWLRAALAASLSRDLCSGCGSAVSWPFRFVARKLDRVVIACRAHATPAPSALQPAAGAIWTVDSVRPISREEFQAFRDARATESGAPGDIAAQYIDARSL